jgi:hypothetical protein
MAFFIRDNDFTVYDCIWRKIERSQLRESIQARGTMSRPALELTADIGQNQPDPVQFQFADIWIIAICVVRFV